MNFEDELQARFEAHEMSQKLRLTRERWMVAHAVALQPDEFTAEELVEAMQAQQTEQRRCARSTIYRTLNMLVELGMLLQRDATNLVFRKNVAGE